MAGIFDGEGTITLWKPTGKKRRNNRLVSLSISSTDREILGRVQKLIGGGIYPVRKTHGHVRWKPAWVWHRNGGGTLLAILQVLVPHLTCPGKRRRAAYLLEHYARVTHPAGRYTPTSLAEKLRFEAGFFDL